MLAKAAPRFEAELADRNVLSAVDLNELTASLLTWRAALEEHQRF